MKQLYRVTVEGEIFVMAENERDARTRAGHVLQEERAALVQHADPVSDVQIGHLRNLDDEVLESFPWNADKGDKRTVADHIKALGIEL